MKKLEKLIKWAIFLVFAVMIAAVVIQVFARTFLEQPPLWTEEASRVALLYIVGLGLGASVLTGDLVNVDLALMLMPKPLRRFCELTSAALVSLFGFFLVPGAWGLGVHGIGHHADVARDGDPDAIHICIHVAVFYFAWHLWPRQIHSTLVCRAEQ